MKLFLVIPGCCHSSCSSITSITCMLVIRIVSFLITEFTVINIPHWEMCLDQCVLKNTDYERPGRKILKTISPNTLRIKIGE